MKKMMRRVLFTLATLITTAFLLASGTDATVYSTCNDAYESNNNVNFYMCVQELERQPGSAQADTQGLAKMAADLGADNATASLAIVAATLADPGTAAKARPAWKSCQLSYEHVRDAFVRAGEEISSRTYAKVKDEVAFAASQAVKCDDGLAKVGIAPSPLMYVSSYAQQMRYVCEAITGLLIK